MKLYVCCDLDIEPLALRRDKESSLAFYVKLLIKGKDSYCKKAFKKNGINVKFQVEEEN